MFSNTALAKISLLAPLCGAMIGAVVALDSGSVATADPLPYGPDTCIQGFVWREAAANDHVCVTPDIRTQTAQQNSLAAQNRAPNGGNYGPDTCKQGFVWRDAFAGDHVCVLPAVRDQAASDNAAAASRVAGQLAPATGGTDTSTGSNTIVFTRSPEMTCQIFASVLGDEPWVDCQSNGFPQSPNLHQASVTALGNFKFFDGNIGEGGDDFHPDTLVAGKIYHLQGWTVMPTDDGITFTYDATNHGMVIDSDLGVTSF